jgi:hypothetical protein
MPELNGQPASTPSEINNNADHVGLSVQQKHFQTESVLLQRVKLKLSSHQKTWSHVTNKTWDVKVDISTKHGNISIQRVPLLIHVSHTPPVVEMPPLAEQPVLMDQHSPNTNAVTLLTKRLLPQLKMKSSELDPWKLDSTYMLISSTTNKVSTHTPVELLKVVMPLKFSDGELKVESTIGSLPTHGVLLGEKRDSSESNKDNAELTLTSTLATQHSEQWRYDFIVSISK